MISNESKRGTGREDIGPVICIEPSDLTNQDQDLRGTKRPGGQDELTRNTGVTDIVQDLGDSTSSKLTFMCSTTEEGLYV